MRPDEDLTVVGIDVGLTYLKPSSGVCQTGRAGFALGHTYADRGSRVDALGGVTSIDVLAIDGPLPPELRLHTTARLCEKVFVAGQFQRRCKPGESHIPGTGRALTRAATDTANQFLQHVSGADLLTNFPRVVRGRNVIEAFPNAFLGVLLPEAEYDTLRVKRGEKMAALLDRARRVGVLRQLREVLDWEDVAFWEQAETNTQHDESAALICALTGVCVVRGQFTAVGDISGGYFFLPPWDLWQPWARDQVQASLRRRGCPVDAPGPHVIANRT